LQQIIGGLFLFNDYVIARLIFAELIQDPDGSLSSWRNNPYYVKYLMTILGVDPENKIDFVRICVVLNADKLLEKTLYQLESAKLIVNAESREGKSLLDYAQELVAQGVVEVLQNHGALEKDKRELNKQRYTIMYHRDSCDCRS